MLLKIIYVRQQWQICTNMKYGMLIIVHFDHFQEKLLNEVEETTHSNEIDTRVNITKA